MANKWEDIMASMVSGNQNSNPEEAPTEAPTEDVIVSEEPVEEEIEETPVEEAPTEEPVDTEDEPEEEAPEVQGAEDGIIEDWADDDSDGDTISAELNFTELGNALGVEDEISSKDDLVSSIKNKFSSYEQQINELSKNVMPDNIPDSLKEAVKVASEGGNYEAYVSATSTDYDSIRDEDLVANSVMHHFADENGSVNEEALFEYLDGMSDTQIKIEGDRIRTALKQNAESQKQSIVAEAKRKRKEVLDKVDSALSSLSDISGFKILPHQKEMARKAFKDDKVITDLFYSNGQLDGNKAVEVYLKNKYFDKMIKHLKTSTRNNVKKQILEETTNAQIDAPTTPPNVEPEKKSGMSSWIDSLKGNN